MRKKLYKNTSEVSEILKILSNQDRLWILSYLDKDEKIVSDIQKNIPAAQSTVSNHLALLKKHGFVSSKRTGKEVKYKIIDKKILKFMKSLRKVFL